MPRSAAAVYSPRIRFVLTPNAFSAFVAFWTVSWATWGLLLRLRGAARGWQRRQCILCGGAEGSSKSSLAILQCTPPPLLSFPCPRPQNGTAKDIRRLQSLVWLIDRNITSSGSVTWDAGTRTVTAQPPAGRWYRLAQVMEVVNVPYFFGGLAGAPPPPAPPPFEYLPPAPPGSKAPF